MATYQHAHSLVAVAHSDSFVHHGDTCDISFTYRSRTALVTFDNLASIDERPDERPWAPWLAKRAAALGYSLIGVQSHQKDWYRTADPAAQLITLRECGFFERFSNVLFVGASMGGFAALCFAGIVPGARVAAFSPQSTLNREIAPFERRYKWPHRKFDWETAAYLDAAQEVSKIPTGHIFFDPFVTEDKLHAQRLSHAGLKLVQIGHADHTLIRTIVKCGALEPLLKRLAEQGTLGSDFWKLMRHRRSDPVWARQFLRAVSRTGKRKLFDRACDLLHDTQGHDFAHRMKRKAKRAAKANHRLERERKAAKPFWTDELSEEALRTTLPVFVNSYNQFSYLRDTVNWFWRHEFKNVCVLDNQSDSPELLDYFKSSDFTSKARVVHLGENLGPRRALAHAAAAADTYRGFVFTDPDLLLPDPCAPDLLKTMIEMGLRHDYVKVGLALSLNPALVDLDRVTFRSKTVEQVERKYWKNKLEEGVFKATTDTTFFAYVPRAGAPAPFNEYGTQQAKIPAIRVGRRGFVAIHRPWLYQDTVPQSELDNYAKTVSRYSTFVRAQRSADAQQLILGTEETPPR